MPVQVRMPVRVRLDPRSLAQRPDRVAEAVAVALARALDRSRREAVEPRGGYLGVRTLDPVFSWTGDAAAGVPGPARRDFEARLRAVVADAVDAARLDPGLPEGVVLPLSEPAAEVADPMRESALLRTYEIPSYQGGGAPEVIDFSDEPAVVVPVVHDWVLRPAADLREHLMDVIREAVRQFGPLPADAPRGLIVKTTDPSGRPAWAVVIFTTPWTTFSFPGFGELVLVPGPNPRFEERPSDPPAVPGTATRQLITDRAALVAATADLMGPDIRARIMRAQPQGETTSNDEYQRRVDAAVDAEVVRRVDGVLAGTGGAAPTSLVVVRLGGSFMLLVSTESTDAGLHWDGTANLLPVTVERPRGRAGGDAGGGGTAGSGGGGSGAAGTGGATGAGGSGAGGGDGDGDSGGAGGPSVGIGSGAGGGSFVYDPTAPTAPTAPPDKEASRFPVVRRPGLPRGEPRGCAPFNGEPSLAELGSAGDGLRRAMEDIAFRLQLGKICEYPANFCLQAAEALFDRAASISAYISVTERDGFTQPTPEGDGALGSLNFRPVASPAVQFLRHLAGVVPPLHRLALAVMRTYEQPEHWAKVHGGWIDSPASWDLHFLREFTPATEAAVGQVLVTGSQALLLQLLLSSRTGINARITNFDRYAPIFERLLVSQLSDYVELQDLRDRLRRHGTATWIQDHTGYAGGAVAAASAVNPATAWFGAARSLSGAFLVAESAFATPGAAKEIVTTDGVVRIRDSHGVMWTEAELEQAMVMQRGQAEGIDPLVKQVTDLPDVIWRFRTDPTAIRRELRRLLTEMSDNNTEMIGKVRADAMFAFRASRIRDNIPSATVPGSRYALQGVHLVVHQELGEFFAGDSFYALGIDALFSAELGREELIGFGLNVGIVLLSVLCPPLGFLAGVVVAANDVRHAKERERLYGSMLDPELVLTRAEVEAELFAAYLGMALSLVPEVGTIGGALARGGRVALRAGFRSGLRAARGYVARRISRQIIEAASRDLLQAFITEILMTEVLGRIIQKALEPVLAHIEREAMLTQSVGGPEGARFILMVLDQERAGAAPAAGAVGAPVVRP
ncbi:hypothetical protein AB0H57_14665 [Micromonospora sp. NPDC050686]|uniref:hypothetical protein n=1 Tax=Micromonospora sp. NPDC050686 TaxID=3154631 RepID=UPI0033E0D967